MALIIQIILLTSSVCAICAEEPTGPETDDIIPRYVVFPGLDAEQEEVAEWNFGWANPFNVFFGPKPYVIGWMGGAPFGPVRTEAEDVEEEEEVEVDEEDPEYEEV